MSEISDFRDMEFYNLNKEFFDITTTGIIILNIYLKTKIWKWEAFYLIKVLIVDDAAFMRMAIRKVLEKNGFEVVGEAENGDVGVEKYKQYKPDIVTMDITMPEKTGIEALKEIRNFDSEANVVMVSAMGQEAMVREAIMNGAKSFIVKPYKEDHIVQTLNNIVT
jgi:two-component system chemotaxis response regulator CheY